MNWDGKRYHSLNTHLRTVFHEKIVKISLDGGFTCPNRDGTIGTTGCIFCSDRGAGDFAGTRSNTIAAQMIEIKKNLQKKWPHAKYIAHFQAFTNTYGPIDLLRDKYEEALGQESVVGLAIATRPDCLSDPVLELLQEFNEKTYLWVELGLQTIHDASAQLIGRGYPLCTFMEAIEKLRSRNISVVNHMILGIPNESKNDMMNSIKHMASLPIQGIKLQVLYVLKNTPLASLYQQEKFVALEQKEYMELIADCIEVLPPDLVIHRLTGDGPKDLLIAPLWTKNKLAVLNGIDQILIQRDSWQGKLYAKPTCTDSFFHI